MKRWQELALLFAIMVVAATLRLTAIDWDAYNNYHPDERYIAWVATSVEWPKNWASAFDPRESTFNPYYWPDGATSDGIVLGQNEPRRFAYGHLPLYLGVMATRLLEKVGPALARIVPNSWLLASDIFNESGLIEYDHITATGRFLAAVFDVLTVLVVYLTGRRLFRPAVGLVAAAFLALNVMHIQLSHFFTVDSFLALFVVSSIAFMVLALRQGQSKKRRTILIFIAALATGLAIGSKFSAVLLLLPLLITVFIDENRSIRERLLISIGSLLLVFSAFFISNPFAVLDWTCGSEVPTIALGPIELPFLKSTSCYIENVALQGTMVRGSRDVPFARQYLGTTPFLYFIEMQLKWGMGFLLGIAAFLGFLWATVRIFTVGYRWLAGNEKALSISGLRQSMRETGGSFFGPYPVTSGEVVLLAWSLPFFLTTGVLMVKFMRYLAPLTPFLMIYAAAMLLGLPWKRWRWLAVGTVLIAAAIQALAFVNMYGQPHPWIAASRWIFENVEPGSTILNEAWDDPLPDTIEIDSAVRRRSEYTAETVNWLSAADEQDSRDKLMENLTLVANADYLILSSNRNYGVVGRLVERYPLSSQYYKLLMDGRLGFEVAYVGNRMPNLFGLYLKPDSFNWPDLATPLAVQDYFSARPGINGGRFDESFTVYDQPLVIVLKNESRLSAEEMRSLFDFSKVDNNNGGT